MGALLSSLVTRSKKILILGPKGAGKTTIMTQIATLYQLKAKVNPYKHFNFLKYKGFNVWDLSGASSAAMQAWTYYYDNTACVIYVYDACNSSESDLLLREICSSKELRHSVFLIVVNKFVNERAAISHQIQKILKNKKNRVVYFVPEVKQVEIKQGFEWISKNA